MTDPQKKYTRAELASRIKNKYPEYSEIEDNELVDLVTSKYPEYNDVLVDESVKKRRYGIRIFNGFFGYIPGD